MTTDLDPPRLLDGGLIDGAPPSPEMLEMLGALEGATGGTRGLLAMHAGVVGRHSWGRWLVLIGLALGVASAPHHAAVAAAPRDVAVAPSSGDDATENARPSVAASPTTLADPSAALALPDAAPSAERDRGLELERSHVPAPRAGVRARVRARVAVAAGRDPSAASLTPDSLATPASIVNPPSDASNDGVPEHPAALVAASTPSVAPALDDDGPPSETMASALSDYARGCCDCALTPFQHVIEGSTSDAPRSVRRAELLLGVCLARLGWTESALGVLDGIAQSGPAHPYFSEALSQLARLAPRLPDPSVLVGAFRYDDEARLLDEDAPDAADAAAFFQGRARYDESDLERAAALFARVSAASPFHRAARFYEGLAEVRLHHAGRAEAAFRAVIDASPEGDRHRDLATLALARLYYAAAESRHAAGDDTRESELLEQALDAWRRVPLSSEHFLDSFFEESWALYLAGEDGRALGHVFGLLSPFFETTEHPEAWVIRGTIHYQHCLYDEAEEDVREFHARYDDVLTALEGLVDLNDADALALRSTRASTLSGPTRSLVSSSIFDRDAERESEHLRAIEDELSRLASAVFARGSLGIRLEQELGISAALARSRVAEGVRSRIANARDTLVERMNEIDRIGLETATARRDVLVGDAVLSEESTREREIIAEVGVEVWPFDGEYWQDEVTSYREVVRDRCGR